MNSDDHRTQPSGDAQVVSGLEPTIPMAGIQNTAPSPHTPGPACPSAASEPPDLPPSPSVAPLAPVRGDKLGRYVILERIGEGGMGVVYAAYDSQLDRRVALKLLRHHGDEDASQGRSRLLREAQAMAKLTHPNVVTIHDVGELDGQVFLTMEFVDGSSMRQWLDKPRQWTEVLEVFLAAGQGLVAAHDAGLVHRDFKPDNVMIDRSGSVKVTDFGLARPAEARTDPPSDDDDRVPDTLPTGASSLLQLDLTGHGGVIGTPAYMAPEQMMGLPSDARSDQFAFCLSLYEALWKKRPFEGTHLAALAKSVEKGPSLPPKDDPVPKRIREAILRGLSYEPDERFASMRALLAALRLPTHGRKRLVAAIVSVVLLAGLVSALGAWRIASRRAAVCRGADQELAGVWDRSRKRTISEAFRATNKPWANGTWKSVSTVVDRYAASWMAARQDACEATRLRKVQTEHVMELRMVCLDKRLAHLRELSNAFARADDATVRMAVEAAASLPSIRTCSDVESLSAVVPPADPAIRTKADEVSAKTILARELNDIGKHQQAKEQATNALREAKELKYPPVEAAALHQLGTALDQAGEYTKAADMHFQASLLAAQGHDDEGLTRALIQYSAVVGNKLARNAEGERWARFAMAMLDHIGKNNEIAGIGANVLGVLALNRGELDTAQGYFEQAQKHLSQALPEEHPYTIRVEINLALVAARRGQIDAALERFAWARKTIEDKLGASHPMAADTHTNAGVALRRVGRHEQAAAEYRLAITQYREAFGPDYPNALGAEHNLGTLMISQGQPQQALDTLQRNYEARKRVYGAENTQTASTLAAIADALCELVRYEEALSTIRAASATLIATAGAEHTTVAAAARTEAMILLRLKRTGDATDRIRRAIAIHEKANGKEHPEVAEDLLVLARLQIEAGKAQDAVQTIDQAKRILAAKDHDELLDLEALAVHTAAQWDIGGDRRQSVTSAQRARDGFRSRGTGRLSIIRELDDWLGSHPSP